MAEVKLGSGHAWKDGKRGHRHGIETLQDAMTVMASCGPGGYDECNGFWTGISATTGELVAMYITGAAGGPYTLVIEDYDTAVANTKLLREART